MEIEFFNKDARETFLSPNSVDLFISHFPFYQRNFVEYGGDPSLQLQNAQDTEEFLDSVLKVMKHMDYALKDSGSIVLILPNGPRTFRIIADIIKETKLCPSRSLTWDFEEWAQRIGGEKDASGMGTNIILYLTYSENLPWHIKGLKSFIIKEDFGASLADQDKYGDIAFMYDALPQALSDLLVLTFSKEGDVVADILAGTGTVAISALKNNRKAIYNDSSTEQIKVAKKRIDDIIGYSQNTTTTIEKGVGMTKEEAVSIMMESINADNLALGLQAGLEEEQLKSQIEQSQPSLGFMMSNIYDKLQAGGVIA